MASLPSFHKESVDMIEKGIASPASEEVTLDKEAERRLVWKIDIRLMPVVALIYLLCYLDRSNIGNAKILNSTTHDDMLQTNNLTAYQFVVALMAFLVAYSVFEAPSNLMLKVLRPNRWLGIIVVIFGCFCTGIAGTQNFAQVTALRFFLGAAEAGVFPGMIFYLSFWYKSEERATRIALFLCSATLAGAFGGAIAFGVGHLNGAHGLEGWRWLFIVEGIPSIVVGVFVFFFLPDYPENASWLSDEEKRLQDLRLGANGSRGHDKLSWTDAKHTLKEVRLWVHYFIYLCAGCGVSSLSLFAPTIVAGLGYKDLQAQLFTVPPYAVAYVCTLGGAIISDRTRSRGLVAAVALGIGSVAFIIQAVLPGHNYGARYAFLIIATSGVFAGLPALCAWVPDNVRSTTAGSLAVGLNIAFTGPGQIIGVWIYRAQDKPFYRLGHAVNAAALATGAVLSLGLWWHYTRLNKRLIGTNATRWVS